MSDTVFPISPEDSDHILDRPLLLISYKTSDHCNYDSQEGIFLPRTITLEFAEGDQLVISSEKWECGDVHGLVIEYKE